MVEPLVNSDQRCWLLPFKVAALVTLIGPAAGSMILGVLAFGSELVATLNGTGNGHLLEMPLGLPWVVMLGYFFGTVPALLGGIAVGLYMHLTGRQPWIAGLVLGALAPPLCLAAIGATGLPQSSADWTWIRDTAKMMLLAGGLGGGAALVTALAIRRLLRRSIAEPNRAARQRL